MFSNIASYIFGGETSDNNTNQGPEATAHVVSHPSQPALSDGEDEWVVVGGSGQPPLTLGSLNEVNPRPPTGSTGSSAPESEVGQDEAEPAPEDQPQAPGSNDARQVALTRTERRLLGPFGSCPNNALLPQVKAVRASQKSAQKVKAKSLSSKALDKKNKAVKHQSHSKKHPHSSNLAIRSAGINKQLKLC